MHKLFLKSAIPNSSYSISKLATNRASYCPLAVEVAVYYYTAILRVCMSSDSAWV